MTVKQVREKLPLCDIYEIDPDKKYILVYSIDSVSHRDAMDMARGMKAGMLVGVMGNARDTFALLEIEKET